MRFVKKETADEIYRLPCIPIELVGDVGKKSDVASALDSYCELSLVLCACAGDSSGKDLSALADELSQLCILVINVCYLVCAKDTNLFSLAVGTEGTCCAFSLIHFVNPPINLVVPLSYQKGRSSSVLISSNLGAMPAAEE